MIVLTSYGYTKGEAGGRPTITVDASEWPGIPRGMHHLTGHNRAIQTHVMANPLVRQVVTLLIAHVDTLTNNLTDEDKAVTVGVRCKDGRHRSVATVEVMAKALTDKGHRVRVHHRDLGAHNG